MPAGVSRSTLSQNGYGRMAMPLTGPRSSSLAFAAVLPNSFVPPFRSPSGLSERHSLSCCCRRLSSPSSMGHLGNFRAWTHSPSNSILIGSPPQATTRPVHPTILLPTDLLLLILCRIYGLRLVGDRLSATLNMLHDVSSGFSFLDALCDELPTVH